MSKAINVRPSLTLRQAANSVMRLGSKIAFLFTGEPGIGKSSILKLLAKDMPTHRPIYLDAPWLDVGDLAMSIPNREERVIERFVAKYLGDVTVPLLIMIDELGKAPAYIAPILNTMIQERRIGDVPFHPDSKVFATTNNAADRVGDVIKAHSGNRVTIAKVGKPSAREYGAFGQNNGFHPTLLSWVESDPSLLESYETANRGSDGRLNNEKIFDPANPQRLSFFTPRSGEKASDILWDMPTLGEEVTEILLAGTIGDAAAQSLMAYVRLTVNVPKVTAAIADPMGLPVPDSTAVQLTFLYHASVKGSGIETAADMTNVLAYVERFGHREFCSLFYTMMASSEHLAPVFRRCEGIKKWGGRNIDLMNV
jgi:hypothetical protein